MIQIRALQAYRALLALKAYEIALVQFLSTLSTVLGGAVLNEHEQFLTVFGVRHIRILRPARKDFNVT